MCPSVIPSQAHGVGRKERRLAFTQEITGSVPVHRTQAKARGSHIPNDMRIHICTPRRCEGAPLGIYLFTRTKTRLWRIFSKSQAYDWKRGCWSGVIDPERIKRDGWQRDNFDIDTMQWKHYVCSPREPR